MSDTTLFVAGAVVFFAVFFTLMITAIHYAHLQCAPATAKKISEICTLSIFSVFALLIIAGVQIVSGFSSWVGLHTAGQIVSIGNIICGLTLIVLAFKVKKLKAERRPP